MQSLFQKPQVCQYEKRTMKEYILPVGVGSEIFSSVSSAGQPGLEVPYSGFRSNEENRWLKRTELYRDHEGAYSSLI